eukprot:gb/GECG01016207.1/.p1 GENE.gb/GECG01016207.1/~~gb/GECG01016207.1/.p1  ORF type:complete len:878 (+),score=155.55 gb/GECG01016207.1/:1-2634(+)
MAQVARHRSTDNGYQRGRVPYELSAFPPEPPSSSSDQSAVAAGTRSTGQDGDPHQHGAARQRRIKSSSSPRNADSAGGGGEREKSRRAPPPASPSAHTRNYNSHGRDEDDGAMTMSDSKQQRSGRRTRSTSSSNSSSSEDSEETDGAQAFNSHEDAIPEKEEVFSDSSSEDVEKKVDTHWKSRAPGETPVESKASKNLGSTSAAGERNEIPRQHKQHMEKLAIENEMLRVQCEKLLQNAVSRHKYPKSHKNDETDALLREDKEEDDEGLLDDVDVKLEKGPLGIHFAQAPPESAYALEVAQIPQMTKDGCVSFVGSSWEKLDNSSMTENLHANTLALKNVQVGMVLVSLGGRDLRGLPAQKVNELLDETPRPLLLRFRMFPYFKLRRKYMALRSKLSSMRIQCSNLEESMRASIERSRRRERQREREKKVLGQRLQELATAYHGIYCKYSELKKQREENEELARQNEELTRELKKAQQGSNTNPKTGQPVDTSGGRMRGASVYIPTFFDDGNQYVGSIIAEQALEERDCAIRALREARSDAESFQSQLAAMQREYDRDKSKFAAVKEDLQKLLGRMNGALGNQPGGRETDATSTNLLQQRIIPMCEHYFSQKQQQLRRLEADYEELEQRKSALQLQLDRVCDMSHDFSKNRPVTPKKREPSSSVRYQQESGTTRELTLKPMPEDDSSPNYEESNEREEGSVEHARTEKQEESKCNSESQSEQKEAASIFKRVSDDPDEALTVARESFEDSKGAVLESWLLKKSKKKSENFGAKWKRRYLSLFSGYIWYHTLPGDSSAKGSFCVKDILRVYKQKSKKGYEFVVEEKNKHYLFRAETEEIRDGWVSVIDEIVSLCTKYSSIGNQEEAASGFEGDSDLSD